MPPPLSRRIGNSLGIAFSILAVVVVVVAATTSADHVSFAPVSAIKSKIVNALHRWMDKAAIFPPYHSVVGGGKSSSKNNVLLHLKDPGYADEDLEGYEFYSYEFHSRNGAGVATTTTTTAEEHATPTRSHVLLDSTVIPSTKTCAQEGTCSVRVDDKGKQNVEDDTNADADVELTEVADEEDAVATQEASYVERASSPGDDNNQSELDTTIPSVPAPTVSYSDSDLAVGGDLGVPQTVTENDAVRQQIVKSRTYLRDVVSDVTNPKYDKVRSICQNKHESCTFWAVHGECQANPAYMLINCAPACESCEQLHIGTRCPMDPNAANAWGPGDLNAMFERIASDPALAQYQPTVLSRPTYAPGDTNETAPYKIGLWMIQFDNAVSEEEADRLRELGEKQGYERSSDVGDEQPDGTYTSNVNEKRTSTNSWCTGDCYADPVAKQVMDRIATITGIPETNSENLQMLRYDVNQFYRTHNDYIPHQKDRQAGVRIATFYIYLNDVEEGGETNFPRNHNLSVHPQKGRAVLWPSVYDSDPHERDRRSDHQAKPVLRGVKYGANAWIHQRDFKGPNARGC